LLRDERSDTLDFIHESIVNFGHKVGIAKDSSEILHMLSSDRYDVILTNGGCRELDIDKDIRLKFPSVFIVGIVSSPGQNGNGDVKADYYLVRPFAKSQLWQAIENL
jgi:DNA-binding response OmpR family regulator